MNFQFRRWFFESLFWSNFGSIWIFASKKPKIASKSPNIDPQMAQHGPTIAPKWPMKNPRGKPPSGKGFKKPFFTQKAAPKSNFCLQKAKDSLQISQHRPSNGPTWAHHSPQMANEKPSREATFRQGFQKAVFYSKSSSKIQFLPPKSQR